MRLLFLRDKITELKSLIPILEAQKKEVEDQEERESLSQAIELHKGTLKASTSEYDGLFSRFKGQIKKDPVKYHEHIQRHQIALDECEAMIEEYETRLRNFKAQKVTDYQPIFHAEKDTLGKEEIEKQAKKIYGEGVLVQVVDGQTVRIYSPSVNVKEATISTLEGTIEFLLDFKDRIHKRIQRLHEMHNG